MLSDEQSRELLEIERAHFEETLYVDCCLNTLTIPAITLTLSINEAQKRLLCCLFSNITCKREIIRIVWRENHQRISDNNYHQLVFQLRALLNKHGLPRNLILTIPYHGLKLNIPLIRSLLKQERNPPQKDASACTSAFSALSRSYPRKIHTGNHGNKRLLSRLYHIAHPFICISLVVII
ncbi:helix-turn-helix domain-containing protein [Pantoea sp. 1.19]|uniref:winged helix-turn-helix domain-containing protein n=1 Tax=Pantoea sp. 1.19 TaxID=1925589 RepID=UPI0011150C12|nr:helix-turn-helix domain-containing protein [Pantoea sp. 1.19]